jgi:hypothetical protein
MKPSVLALSALPLAMVAGACSSQDASKTNPITGPAFSRAAVTQRFAFKNFGRQPTIGKEQSRPPMVPAAAFSNRAVELTRISTTGSAAALAAYSGVANDSRIGLLSSHAARIGCQWSFNSSGSFQTRMSTTWTGVATATEAGFRTNPSFTSTFILLRCGTSHSAGLLIVQQDGLRAALRLVYRQMKPDNTMIEEVKITRNGRGTDIAKASLGDAYIRTAEMVAKDVAPGVGKVVSGALMAEGGMPIERLMARLLDANNSSGLPDAFAGWYLLSVVSSYEEDLPGTFSVLPPKDTYRPRPKDNFLERVLRVIDSWYDKNRDKVVEAALNYLVEAINGKSPATEDNVRAPRR